MNLSRKKISSYPEIKFFLELTLNNNVFSSLEKFCQQLQGAVTGCPVSPVSANIYMKYFEELAPVLECPVWMILSA